MTFRIDEAWRHTGGWKFRIKGIEGKSVYGTLLTDDDGRGLYLIEFEPELPPINRPELIPPKEFRPFRDNASAHICAS